MSTHPNAILMAVLTPHDLSRKTMRAIHEESGANNADSGIKIGGEDYSTVIMESDYEENYQIRAKEGDLIFLDMVTYGYGEFIRWAELASKKEALEKWAQAVCVKHHCDYEIRVSANYW